METIYILTSRMMNGTVTMYTHSAAFATKKLAEKTMEKLKELNNNGRDFPINYSIQECDFYKEEDEIPVLND